MSFFAILLALLIEQARPLPRRNPIDAAARLWAQWIARNVDAGKPHHAWLVWGLVVGVPTHPDGGEHENTLRARKFARQLRGRFGLQVHEVDERYTTTEAHSLGARDADAAAAAIILEQFLRSLP